MSKVPGYLISDHTEHSLPRYTNTKTLSTLLLFPKIKLFSWLAREVTRQFMSIQLKIFRRISVPVSCKSTLSRLWTKSAWFKTQLRWQLRQRKVSSCMTSQGFLLELWMISTVRDIWISTKFFRFRACKLPSLIRTFYWRLLNLVVCFCTISDSESTSWKMIVSLLDNGDQSRPCAWVRMPLVSQLVHWVDTSQHTTLDMA